MSHLYRLSLILFFILCFLKGIISTMSLIHSSHRYQRSNFRSACISLFSSKEQSLTDQIYMVVEVRDSWLFCVLGTSNLFVIVYSYHWRIQKSGKGSQCYESATFKYQQLTECFEYIRITTQELLINPASSR
jgi:hypothetical protein